MVDAGVTGGKRQKYNKATFNYNYCIIALEIVCHAFVLPTLLGSYLYPAMVKIFLCVWS